MSDPQQERPRVDALSAITADLDSLQGHRRRHFTPALLMSLGVVALILVMMGTRPDLIAQPSWQLALQAGSWMVCLLVFPAIGVGLWFPSRTGRWLLATLGIGLSVVAALGWPAMPSQGQIGGPCAFMVVGTGLVLLGIGALSGAFAQRRAHSAVYWVAMGIGLAGLNVVTWMCPNTSHDHVTFTHLAPALGLVIGVTAFGSWLRKRSQR